MFYSHISNPGFTTKSSEENALDSRDGKQFTANKCLLSIPTKSEDGSKKLKKVAVVELFFDIIYEVHIGNGDHYQRHSGQKRTYRMVMYFFGSCPASRK